MTDLQTLLPELGNDGDVLRGVALMFGGWAASDLAKDHPGRLEALRRGELNPADIKHPGARVGACLFLRLLSPAEQDFAIGEFRKLEGTAAWTSAERHRASHRFVASYGFGDEASEDRLVYSGTSDDELACCASEVGEPVSARPGEYELVHGVGGGSTRTAFLTFRGGEGCPEGITEECLLEVLTDRLRQRLGFEPVGVGELRKCLAERPWGGPVGRLVCPDCEPCLCGTADEEE